jgi:hypothetical protein
VHQLRADRIKKLCIKLVIKTILYYDARSEKHQTNQLVLYWGIIVVCSEIYSFIEGFPLYTVFPRVPVSQYSLLSPVVSHTASSPSLSLGLPFVLFSSGSYSRTLHDSLFSGVLFKYPNRRSSFPTITVIYAFLLP